MCVGRISTGTQGNRIYSINGKSTTLSANGGGLGANTGLYAEPVDVDIAVSDMPLKQKDIIHEVIGNTVFVKGKQYPIKLKDGHYKIRRLSVDECKRLQTIPQEYRMPCSNAQNYKMLGNGWTCAVISHILSFIPNIKNEDVEVLSMYDGMSCAQIALNAIGANVVKYYATEIDKYAIQTCMANFPDTIQLGDAFQAREKYFIRRLRT